MQEHRTHGEVAWTAYHQGVRIPEGSVQEPDFVVAAIDHPGPEQIERVAAKLGLPDDWSRASSSSTPAPWPTAMAAISSWRCA